MGSMSDQAKGEKPTHRWLRELGVSFAMDQSIPILATLTRGLQQAFTGLGHQVIDPPDTGTDILITNATFGEPIPWRKALFFTMRKRFNLDHNPTLFTVVHLTPKQLEDALDRLTAALAQSPLKPEEFALPGLAPESYRVLMEQGRRGGPILTLQRQIQAQSKSIRVLMVVGEETPEFAYLFDLVGAYPRIDGKREDFYTDIVLRISTAMSTQEVTEHEVLPDPISAEAWRSLQVPRAMCVAGTELGKRSFFTEMVRVADLVHVPAVSDGVANQYSEGCFASWESGIPGLISTVTGSARPVEKDAISEDDLAVIVGVREDGRGALVRQVEGKRNDPPSSEAVELREMDLSLPTVQMEISGETHEVPVVRSKLHGHRGIASYDPNKIEHVALDPPYYHYPVSCATEAQAQGIKAAFRRSEALQNPQDPRKIVFTVLPGHGVVIAEKWMEGKQPFQLIWEAIDAGELEVVNHVPQGLLTYQPDPHGRMILTEE
jgi:hypothetical protein